MAAPDKPIGQAVWATALSSSIIAALLVIPAGLVPHGTWLWRQAIWLIGGLSAVTLVGNLALAIRRPAHFQVRQQGLVAPKEKRQPWLDAVGAVTLNAFGAAWLAFIPIDVFSLRLLPQPGLLIQSVGGLAVVIGAALTPIAVWENRFAAPNVQDQSGDGQRIVDTGVYRFVRHPIYLGNLLLTAGAALWLGSMAAALIGVGVLTAATIGRIAIEERHLRAHFPAYADYARRVRGRLIPFLI